MISKRSGGKRGDTGECQHHHHHHHHHHHNTSQGMSNTNQNADSATKSLAVDSSRQGPSAVANNAVSEALLDDLRIVEEGLTGEVVDVQLEAARKLRELLSSHRDLLIREVLHRNWVPRLLGWLRMRDRPTLQVEALWALTNIAAGTTEHTPVLMKHGVVQTLVSLLDSTNEEVLEQSIWVLGNLAGEGASTRDAVLNAGVLRPLVKVLKETSKLSLLRIGTWALSNLCDGQPRPVFDITSILPTLASLLEETDTEVLSHICWALSHLCDGPSSHIQMVVNQDVCWRLVELLMHRSWRVTKPALRTIGNIVCAEDDHDYTQHIIDCGAVPCLRQLIGHSNREIQKESCWTLSNIAAGTIDQIQCVLDSGSIPPLVKLASDPASDSEVKSEACWVVLNATSCGSDAQIEYLVKHGCVEVLGDLLSESSMVMMALEGLERILQVGEELALRLRAANPYASLLASTKIEELETHKSAAVAKRATRIWKQHFVTCAICDRAFSKHSPETFFCEECKCNVCANCDCTVFHLAYQESFWKGETEKEEVQKEAKQATKRNKRQKKKKKQKKKKAAMKHVPESGTGDDEDDSGSGEDQEPSSAKENDMMTTGLGKGISALSLGQEPEEEEDEDSDDSGDFLPVRRPTRSTPPTSEAKTHAASSGRNPSEKPISAATSFTPVINTRVRRQGGAPSQGTTNQSSVTAAGIVRSAPNRPRAPSSQIASTPSGNWEAAGNPSGGNSSVGTVRREKRSLNGGVPRPSAAPATAPTSIHASSSSQAPYVSGKANASGPPQAGSSGPSGALSQRKNSGHSPASHSIPQGSRTPISPAVISPKTKPVQVPSYSASSSGVTSADRRQKPMGSPLLSATPPKAVVGSKDEKKRPNYNGQGILPTPPASHRTIMAPTPLIGAKDLATTNAVKKAVFPDVFADSKIDEMLDENDELVSFLEQTGSILALASRLDQEDGLLY